MQNTRNNEINAEQALLACLLIEPNVFDLVYKIVQPKHFGDAKLKKVYQILEHMILHDKSIDLVTVTDECSKVDPAIKNIAIELFSAPVLLSNVEDYAFKVLENYFYREIKVKLRKIEKDLENNKLDPLDVVDKTIEELLTFSEERYNKDFRTADYFAKNVINKISTLKNQQYAFTGIPTGLTNLDLKIGGLQKGDFLLVASRPSMGKTALALSMALHIISNLNTPVGFFSLEMSAEQLIFRLVSMLSEIDHHRIRNGSLKPPEWEVVEAITNQIGKFPLVIDDTPSISITEIFAKARRMKNLHGIEVLFIDYLQLINPPKAESREREISILAKSLKNLAKELDIPVVTMAQLNRAVEQRNDKRPQLADLRESGSLEQDADIVLLIYRPEFYGLKTWKDNDDFPIENGAELIIAKHRNGPTGSLKLTYRKEFTRFEDRISQELKSVKQQQEEEDIPF